MKMLREKSTLSSSTSTWDTLEEWLLLEFWDQRPSISDGPYGIRSFQEKKNKQTNKISAAPLPIWAGLLRTVEPVTNRKLLYQPTYFPEEKLKERFSFIWFVILIWNFTLLMVQLHDFFVIFLQWPRQLLQFVGGLHWKDWLHFMGSLIDQSSIQQIYGFFRSHHIFIKVNDLQNHVTVSWFMIIKTYTLCRSSLDFSSFLIIKFMILF